VTAISPVSGVGSVPLSRIELYREMEFQVNFVGSKKGDVTKPVDQEVQIVAVDRAGVLTQVRLQYDVESSSTISVIRSGW
jgi:hypothetical protein